MLDAVVDKCETREDRETELTLAVMDAWTLVDVIQRVRTLVQDTPGFSGDPATKIFLRGTGDFKEHRDHYQHLRGQISNSITPANPILGGISWVPSMDPSICLTALTGTLQPGTECPTISFDTHEKCFTSTLTIFAADSQVNLSEGIKRLRALRSALRTWLDAHPNVNCIDKRETLILTVQAPASAG